MARAATSSDVFNAVAEPRRRAILDYLAGGEQAVTAVVDALGLDQPSVSKHLRVLRDVGLVSARRLGRQQLYRVNGMGLKPMYEWTRTYERFWTHQLGRIRQRAEGRVAGSPAHQGNKIPGQENR